MNILYLCSDSGIPVRGGKGASVHVRSLISAFAAGGHSVALATPMLVAAPSDVPAPVDAQLIYLPLRDSDVEAMEALQRFGSRVGVTTMAGNELRRILYNEDLERRIIVALGDRGIDFVYERAAVYGTAGVAIARRLGVPLVVELNAPLAVEPWNYRGTSFPELAREAERYTLTHADAVLTESAPLRDYVLALGAAAERVLVMPHGIDPRVFAPGVASFADRARRDVGPGPVIGFVGGLRPWHGVQVLPRLIERLVARYAAVQMVIAGDGPLREALAAGFSERGVAERVRFTGAIPHDEIPALVRTFDIALAPYEPAAYAFYFSPLNLFEYMGCGTAVVAAALGEIADVISDGEDGLLYEPGNEDALVAACVRLLDDSELRHHLGQRAAANVRRRFTWLRNADAIVALVDRARGRLHVA